MTATNAMNGCAASSPIWRAKWEAWVESIGRNWRAWRRSIAERAGSCRRPRRAREQACRHDRRRREDTSLEEAKQALHIPSVSLALIDQDSIAFARAYGENATPNTLYQAASLSKFVAAVGAMRVVEQKKLALDGDVNAKLTSWKSRPMASTKAIPSPCAACRA
jgi:CubicO group peptidase (beta-lactamase class C family)